MYVCQYACSDKLQTSLGDSHRRMGTAARSSNIWSVPAAAPLAKLWLIFNRWAHVKISLLLETMWLVLIRIIYIYDITVSLSSLFFNGVINRLLLFSPGALTRSQEQAKNSWKMSSSSALFCIHLLSALQAHNKSMASFFVSINNTSLMAHIKKAIANKSSRIFFMVSAH